MPQLAHHSLVPSLPSRCLQYSLGYADDDLDKLCQEFPDYDRGLLEAMLADQGGDAPEVRACLRVMLI